MDMKQAIDVIREELDERDILEQLAEEAAELSQAALKLIRARGLSHSKTPTPEVLAADAVIEEATDVMMCLAVLDIVPDAEGSPKWQRWVNRLKRQL